MKIHAAVIGAALVLALTACSDSTDDSTPSPSGTDRCAVAQQQNADILRPLPTEPPATGAERDTWIRAVRLSAQIIVNNPTCWDPKTVANAEEFLGRTE